MRKKLELGELGELVVQEICRIRNLSCVRSSDKYDDEKDHIIESSIVEVKTQFPLISKEMFTFAATQEKKLREVDYTLILAYSNGWSYDWLDKIYVMLPTFKMGRYKQNGTDMICVHREDPAIFWWADIPEDISQEMRRITTVSEYFPKTTKWEKVKNLSLQSKLSMLE